MAGLGGVYNEKWKGVVPKECKPSPSVLRLNAKLVWEEARESDTVREEDAKAYKRRMERFIHNIRSDLKLPNLLVIQVALASGDGKFINMVRYAQLSIKLPNVRCLDAKGLRLKGDNLHLTSMSEVHLGIQLAHAYLASTNHHFNYTQIR
ncbi:hypothetical protein RYX36_022722 [Vicia faba]